MYVRHAAWLATAPDRPANDRSQLPQKTRAEQMEEDAGGEFEPDMPDPGPAGYLLGHLWSVGPTQGDQPLTHGELRHYQENVGVVLTPWECSMLRRLSGEYLSESHKARRETCPAPFKESTDEHRLRAARLERNMSKFLD